MSLPEFNPPLDPEIMSGRCAAASLAKERPAKEVWTATASCCEEMDQFSGFSHSSAWRSPWMGRDAPIPASFLAPDHEVEYHQAINSGYEPPPGAPPLTLRHSYNGTLSVSDERG